MPSRDDMMSATVRVQDTLQTALKTHAMEKQTPLQQVYFQAVSAFLQRRLAEGAADYVNQPKGARMRTLWLPRKLLRNVRKIATQDRTTMASFLYTALLSYANAQGLTFNET